MSRPNTMNDLDSTCHGSHTPPDATPTTQPRYLLLPIYQTVNTLNIAKVRWDAYDIQRRNETLATSVARTPCCKLATLSIRPRGLFYMAILFSGTLIRLKSCTELMHAAHSSVSAVQRVAKIFSEIFGIISKWI